MPIRKQEFYEGAALHQIACGSTVSSIRYEAPFFRLNDEFLVLLKHCTKNRSPWGFTFSHAEQTLLREKTSESKLVIGLICGADGIAAIEGESLFSIAALSNSAIHIACFRRHGQHYEVKGPDGILDGKVPPSRWQRLLLLKDAIRETS
jgi:hypothetical protein